LAQEKAHYGASPSFLSVVIPAYNERLRLGGTLERVIEYLSRQTFRWEVLVVDDGSDDDTAGLVEACAAGCGNIRLLRNPANRGKGYSVRHGMIEAHGDWILSSDADLSTPIEESEKLLAAALREDAAVAIGSRALDRSLVSHHQSGWREFSGRVFNRLMRALTGLPFEDTQCGFKLFRRDAALNVFPRQRLDGFCFDVEDLFLAQRAGFRTVEVPVRWANAEGSKVTLSKGLRSFADLLRIRINQFSGRYDGDPISR
jgi:dolichyl-phosphate beta-glucosyltransferase